MLYPNQIFSFLVLFLYFFKETNSEQITFCYRSEICYELNDKTFDSKWANDLEEKLNNIETFKVYDLVLSEENFVTLFSHKLPKVKKMILFNPDLLNPRQEYLHRTQMTPKMTETVFKSQYFSQLQELDLSGSNLQFRHFRFLQHLDKPIISNLKKFVLDKNYLERKGFMLLQKINFNGKLETLSLTKNSLIAPQSIDSIKRMIKPIEGQKSQLKNLTVFKTFISTDSMIKLLDNIQVSQMIDLNIGHNSFQHSKSFEIPFNNSFYDYLSKCNFSSLQNLRMSELDLDDEQLPYLKKLKLPLLRRLQLNDNFIVDDYFSQWITKQNMPKLTELAIKSNKFTDKALKSLVEQNFTHLTHLQLSKNRRLTHKHIQILSVLESSKWTSLQFSENSFSQNGLRMFFQGKIFENLKSLVIEEINGAQTFFQYIPWSSMTMLKILILDKTDISLSIKEIRLRNIKFPSLKFFKFGGDFLIETDLNLLISNLTNFGPNLQSVNYRSSQTGGPKSYTAYANISSLKIQTFPKGMYLISQPYMTIYIPENGTKFQIVNLMFNGFMTNDFTKTVFHYSFFGNYDQDDEFWKQCMKNDTQLNLIREWLLNIAVFQRLQNLQINKPDHYILFAKLFLNQSLEDFHAGLDRYKKQIYNIEPEIYLPYLKDMIYYPAIISSYTQNQTIFLYHAFKLEMPILLGLPVSHLYSTKIPQLLNKLLKQNTKINRLLLMGNAMDCQMFLQTFENVSLLFLQRLLINNNEIKTECFGEFIDRHRSIKYMEVAGNFLQKGLFDQVLAKYDLIIYDFQFGHIQIGNDQLVKFSQVNRQFLESISAQEIDVDSDGIKWLVGNITGPLCPRCESIDLTSNRIDQEGITALLQTGMPFLKSIQIRTDLTPNIRNVLFQFPNHFEMVVMQQFIYGLDPEIDPRSSRHTKLLALLTSSLTVFDFNILSRLDWPKLQKLIIVLENTFQCEILTQILRMSNTIDNLQLHIKNERTKRKVLHDQCIKKPDPNQVNVRQNINLQMEWVQNYAFIPNFYMHFFSKDQIISSLDIDSFMIGDDVLLHIIEKCNMSRLNTVSLDNNMLTDKSVSKLLQLNLSSLVHLDVSRNFITSEVFKVMVGRELPKLRFINLRRTQIDDKGIEYLTEAFFPELTTFSSANTDISREGVLKLFELKAPKLQNIFIDQIEMTEDDLIWLVKNVPFKKFPSLQTLSTSVRLSDKNQQKINFILNKKYSGHKFQVKFEQYYIGSNNSAFLNFDQQIFQDE